MLSMVFRTTIMFFLVMFSLRLMGKKSLGAFQPSDLVSTMLISNLTSIVIEAPELPVLYSVVPILLIMCYEVFVSMAAKKNDRLAAITQGKIKILVKNGIINQKVMKELRFTVNDILEAMRGKDIFYLEEVNLAIVETNGTVNIYPDPKAQTNLEKAVIPPFAIIKDGKTYFENLNIIGIDEDKIYRILKKENTEINRIMLLLVDSNGNYNITLKEDI